MKQLLIAFAAPFLIASCACSGSPGTSKTYVCACGEDCPKCKSVSDQPGTCACGKPLVAR